MKNSFKKPVSNLTSSLYPSWQATMDTINSYQPVDPVSSYYKSQCVDLLSKHPDQFANRYNYNVGVHGHLTVQACVFNPQLGAIGLMHHKKLGLWVGFGGHIDPEDKDLISAALRETREESGLQNLTPQTLVPIDLDIHGFPAKGDQPDHLHFDVRFLVITTDKTFAPNNESLAIEWVQLVDLPEKMGRSVSNNRLIHYLQNNLI